MDTQSTTFDTKRNEEDIDGLQFQFVDIVAQDLHRKTLEQIRLELGDSKIFISLSFCDYTKPPTPQSHILANIIVGPLLPCRNDFLPSKQCFLLKSVPFDYHKKYDDEDIVHLFKDSMKLIYPDEAMANSRQPDLMLFITERRDTDDDMIVEQAVRRLRRTYTGLLHLGSLVTLLDELRDDIRFHFPQIAQLHHSMRTMMAAESLIEIFRKETELPELPHGFIESCAYYAKHFDTLKAFFVFASNEAISGNPKYSANTGLVALLFQSFDSSIERQLKLLFQNRSESNIGIDSIYTAKLLIVGKRKSLQPLLSLSIESIENIRQQLCSLCCADGGDDLLPILERYNTSIRWNRGYRQLMAISKVMQETMMTLSNDDDNDDGKNQNDLDGLHRCVDSKISCLRYAPIGGIDRKHCFSKVDSILFEEKISIEQIDSISVVNCFWQANFGNRKRKHYGKDRFANVVNY